MNLPLSARNDPDRRCLRVEDWPVGDRLAWNAALQAGDILDGTVGAGHHWSHDTRHKYRRGYGRWLTFLTRTGRLDASLRPAIRISPENVRAYLGHLQSYTIAPWTVWGRMAELLAVARAFSQDEDWSWLRQVLSSLQRSVTNAKDKLPYLRSAHEIADWSYRQMDAILTAPPLRHAETRYRDALMVALLISCPTMRLRNLAMIRIGQHLLEHSDGFRLAFAHHETKTRRPITIPVPASLSAYMRRYLVMVRRQLLRGESDRLWITREGTPMTEFGIHAQIKDTTRRAFGKPIHPHLFRDCAVTTVALEDPVHIGIAPGILGHSDPKTAEGHYIQANALVAARRLRQSIEHVKQEFPRRRAHGRATSRSSAS